MPGTMILDFELELPRKITQAHLDAIGAGVARDVTQRLLEHAVDVNAQSCRPRAGVPVRS